LCHDTPLEYDILAGLAILEHYNLDKKDEKNATGSVEVTGRSACNFATRNPWIVIVKINGLFLSITFFAAALNISTRTSVISTKRNSRRSVFQ